MGFARGLVAGFSCARATRHPGSHEPAGKAMAQALALAGAGAGPGDAMIVGHAGYLSFLALEIVDALAVGEGRPEAWREAARAVILAANVGEVCGFEVGEAGARYSCCWRSGVSSGLGFLSLSLSGASGVHPWSLCCSFLLVWTWL